MPIITKEHIKTLLWLLLVTISAVSLTLIIRKSEILLVLPQHLLEKPKVMIRLEGGVLQEGVREVDRKLSIWQVVSANNPMAPYINWQKLPLTGKVFEGLDLFVPLRKLRSGETISWKQIIESRGKLLLTLPCDFSIGKNEIKKDDFTIWERKNYNKIRESWNEQVWMSEYKQSVNNPCLAKYIATNTIEE